MLININFSGYWLEKEGVGWEKEPTERYGRGCKTGTYNIILESSDPILKVLRHKTFRPTYNKWILLYHQGDVYTKSQT